MMVKGIVIALALTTGVLVESPDVIIVEQDSPLIIETEDEAYFSFTVKNIGTEEEDLRVHISDVGTLDGGGPRVFGFDEVSTNRSLWVEGPREEFSLKPSGEEKFSYKVSLPPGIEGGEYFVAFVLSNEEEILDSRLVGLKVTSTQGISQLILGDIEYDSEGVYINIQNTGTVTQKPKIMLKVLKGDSEVLRVEEELGDHYEHSSSTNRIGFPKHLRTGKYIVEVEASYGEESTYLVQEIEIEGFDFASQVYIAIFIILGGIMVWLIMKRLKV